METRSLLFSVRMRASRGGPHEEGGRHLSGAERLVPGDELERVSLELLHRGRVAGADHLRLTVDRVEPGAVRRTSCLDVTTVDCPDPGVSRRAASEVLRRAGVTDAAIAAGFAVLAHGPNSDGRAAPGAVLLDTHGKPVSWDRGPAEPDRNAAAAQVVRASRFDYAPEGRSAVLAALENAGLGHFRTFEALALASKVIWSGVTAELCWSDDPAYVAGYVATARDGYVRFPRFKPPGAVGGRVFFLQPGSDAARIVDRLRNALLWIEGVPTIQTVPAESKF